VDEPKRLAAPPTSPLQNGKGHPDDEVTARAMNGSGGLGHTAHSNGTHHPHQHSGSSGGSHAVPRAAPPGLQLGATPLPVASAASQSRAVAATPAPSSASSALFNALGHSGSNTSIAGGAAASSTTATAAPKHQHALSNGSVTSVTSATADTMGVTDWCGLLDYYRQLQDYKQLAADAADLTARADVLFERFISKGARFASAAVLAVCSVQLHASV